MSIVYVLGAGASYGESIQLQEGADPGLGARLTSPPLVRGFFTANLYNHLGYTGTSAEADFLEAFKYIRHLKHIPEQEVGTGAWESLDLEEIFTAVELEREFCDEQSDEYSRLTIVRNKLLRYIGRVIALCTQGGQGRWYRQLTTLLGDNDSLLTFNWDLLLDAELSPRESIWHYRNFFQTVLQDFRFQEHPVFGPDPGHGVFLKLHGSFNWYRCTNRMCPQASSVAFYENTAMALDRLMGIGPTNCEMCGSQMNPLLIPPLLRKPINDNSIFRAIWGTARRRLESATKVVVLGYSLPTTDFYASWLLRSVQNQANGGAQVFVVNPLNDPNHAEHPTFRERMRTVFPKGYNSEFHKFDQLDEIVQRVRQQD